MKEIEKSKNKKKIEEKERDLITSMMAARRDLHVANKNFESAEEDLIDYYSYEIKAAKSKLNYLIKKVKEKGIVLDMINELEFRIQDKVI